MAMEKFRINNRYPIFSWELVEEYTYEIKFVYMSGAEEIIKYKGSNNTGSFSSYDVLKVPLIDGLYKLYVISTDSLGRTSDEDSGYEVYVYDSSYPIPSISAVDLDPTNSMQSFSVSFIENPVPVPYNNEIKYKIKVDNGDFFEIIKNGVTYTTQLFDVVLDTDKLALTPKLNWSDGVHQIFVKSYDSEFGNESISNYSTDSTVNGSGMYTFKIKTENNFIPDLIEITDVGSSANTYAVKYNFLDVRAKDHGFLLAIDNGNYSSYDSNTSETFFFDQSYDIHFKSIDEYGNESDPYTITMDRKQNELVAIINNINIENTSRPRIIWNTDNSFNVKYYEIAIDSDFYHITVDQYFIPEFNLSSGNHKLKLRYIDTNNNRSNIVNPNNGGYDFIIDLIGPDKPIFTSETLHNTVTNLSNYYVRWIEPVNDILTYQLAVDTSELTEDNVWIDEQVYECIIENIEDGDHAVYVRSYNPNTKTYSDISIFNFKVDRSPVYKPVLLNPQMYYKAFSVEWEPISNAVSYNVSFIGQGYNNNDENINIIDTHYFKSGIFIYGEQGYTFSVSAVDVLGNVSEPSILQFTAVDNLKIVHDIYGNPDLNTSVMPININSFQFNIVELQAYTHIEYVFDRNETIDINENWLKTTSLWILFEDLLSGTYSIKYRYANQLGDKTIIIKKECITVSEPVVYVDGSFNIETDGVDSDIKTFIIYYTKNLKYNVFKITSIFNIDQSKDVNYVLKYRINPTDNYMVCSENTIFKIGTNYDFSLYTFNIV